MIPRELHEKHERGSLASYAQLSSESLGRQYPEGECPLRTCFYRDLGRIVHSTAFRLLEYKTQVFVNHEGDYYRTRLTHSLEVSQISRGLARILGVNEDLSHTIALAHDLGHPPFGHSGEKVLNRLMKTDGGFEHNMQGFRVVTRLEERYPDFRGLNLSYEVLEGILKHTTDYDSPKMVDNFKDCGFPTIESQIVNCADEIAYINHDLDDGIHWGMLTTDSLKDVRLWDETYKEVKKSIPNAADRILRIRTISSLIGKLIDDIQVESRRRILENGIKTLKDVREKGKNIVSFSDDMKVKTDEAKKFLFEKVYHHEKVVKMAKRAEGVVSDLFRAYSEEPKRLPKKYRERLRTEKTKRAICDYIAGMTDRFALSEHRKLTSKVGVVTISV